MKLGKKIGSMALAMAMIFSVNVSAFAADNTENMDMALRNRGYPQVILDRMSPTAKESLYEKDYLEFQCGVITTYDEDSGEFADYNIYGSNIMPVGQIPVSDLTLTWLVSNDTQNDELFVQYSYNWEELPFFRWQDPIAVSWDDSLFEMKDDSFYKVDKYDGYSVNTAGFPINSFTGMIKSEEYGYASGYNAGVTWYADLVGHNPAIVVEAMYGHGEFTLEKKTSGSGSSKIYGHYVHPTASVGASISIPKFGSFSVSGGGGYDERGNQTTIKY